MERKLNSGLQVKELNEKGEGVAVIATTGVIDKDDDVCVRGAFSPPDQNVPIVPAHVWTEAPMGKARVFEHGDEVVAELRMNLDTTLGKEWYSAMKWDLQHPPAKQEFSWGFDIKDFSFGEHENRKVRFLKSLRMLEVSPVLVGASVNTRLLSMKSDKDDPAVVALNRSLIQQSITQKKSRLQLTEAVAERAKVDPAVIYRVLSGDLKPTNNILEAAAIILGDESTKKPIASGRIVPNHGTEAKDGTWDAAANERRVKSNETLTYYQRIYGWQDVDADPASKGAWKFIHHFTDDEGNPGSASIRACTLGIGMLNGARGGSMIPDSDRRGVWDHLARHLEDAGITPPMLRSSNEISQKLIDQLTWLKWDAEAMLERVRDVQELRVKEGRSLPEDRIDQIVDFGRLIKELDEVIRRPIVDGKAHEVVQGFHQLRGRILGIVGST